MIPSRSISLRRRPDLVVQPQPMADGRRWIVKDPVALRYFHLQDEEHFILQAVNGHASTDDICRAFEQQFAPKRLDSTTLHALLARFHGYGLLLVDQPGQGDQLLTRFFRQRRQHWLTRLTSVLAIRFRGVDPQRFLDWAAPQCSWLFSMWCVVLSLLVALSATVLVAVQFDTVMRRLPELETFFSLSNIFWIAIAIACVKILHELGHAMACKHFGGECHEIGLMFLVFVPCLYCDVSDAWTFRHKWHRIAVSMAGIYVELVLSSLCVFLWWFSHPGWFHALCLNTMFVCSVGTIFINGNPFMRYDGYYILADLVDAPNLRQRAAEVWRQAIARIYFGIELPTMYVWEQSRRGWLALYGLSSWTYRIVLLSAIVWLSYQFFKSCGLELLAHSIFLCVLVSVIQGPVSTLVATARHPGQRRQLKWHRTLVMSLLTLTVAMVLLAIPFPYRVTAPVLLKPASGRDVYATIPGRLVEAVPEGTQVEANQIVARLVNLDVDSQIKHLRGDRDQQRSVVHSLQAQRSDDTLARKLLPAAKKALADLESRLEMRERDRDYLLLRAPIPGTILSPPRQSAESDDQEELPHWSGTPLEPHNLGSFIDTGTHCFTVGNPEKLEAFLIVEQANLPMVSQGQQVRMVFDSAPGKILSGQILELSRTEVQAVPRELGDGQNIAIRADPQGRVRPTAVSYEARVELDRPHPTLLTGSRGNARIITQPRSLAWRLTRWIAATFRFEL